MKPRELRHRRLTNLGIAAPAASSPGDVVCKLGALQAQDYPGALWAIGLRSKGCTLEDVQRAVSERRIVRTWPMRGTLHFVAAEDVGWLLDLLAARVIAASKSRPVARELSPATLLKVEKLLVRELAGRQLTRDAICNVLERAKISTADGRLYHYLVRLALEKVVCCGAPEGKQPTFALLRDWVPASKPLARDEALARLAARYFGSHGPATLQDLMRWAGVTSAEAKLGVAGAAAQLTTDQTGGVTYYLSAESPEPPAAARGMFILPGFDEYMLGYKDRTAMLDAAHASKIVPGGNGMFRATLVHDGRVVGTWRANPAKHGLRLTPTAFESLSDTQLRQFARAGARYGRFLSKPVLPT